MPSIGTIVGCDVGWDVEDSCLRESAGSRTGCRPKQRSGSGRCCSTINNEAVLGEHFGIKCSIWLGSKSCLGQKGLIFAELLEGKGV